MCEVKGGSTREHDLREHIAGEKGPKTLATFSVFGAPSAPCCDFAYLRVLPGVLPPWWRGGGAAHGDGCVRVVQDTRPVHLRPGQDRRVVTLVCNMAEYSSGADGALTDRWHAQDVRRLAVETLMSERTVYRWYAKPSSLTRANRLRLERAAARMCIPLPVGG